MTKEIENILFSRFVKQPIPFEFISIKELYDRCAQSQYDLSNPHRIEFHALIIITEGNSRHTIDFHVQEIYQGVILPITKGQVHSFNKELTVKGFVISFDEVFITENISEKNLFHFFHLYNTPSIHLGKQNLKLVEPYLQLLKRQQNHSDMNLKAELIHTAFIMLLLQIKHLANYQKNIFESQRFKDFIQLKQLITKHYKQSHNAKEYAKMMRVSYKYLNDVCKEVCNKTVKAFIDDWLLLEIKRNISENKYTSQEIAYKMGFKEHSNFIRFFKKFTGTTPHKFKSEIH